MKKISVLSATLVCIGESPEGEVPYWHRDHEGTFTIMVPIYLPNTRKPELLFKREDSGEEYYEVPYTYRYKMTEVIVFSGNTKHACNRNGSSGECPRVMLSLTVKEYSERTDDLISLTNCLSCKTVEKKSSIVKRLEWIRKFHHSCIIDESNNKWRKLIIKEEKLVSKKDMKLKMNK